jgi:hypothetical protein
MDDRLAFTAGADVVRGRCRICTDAGDVDEALHAGLAGKPSDARRRLNVDSMEGLAAIAFDVEADGVHDPVGADKHRGDRGLIMHIGSDRLLTHHVPSERQRHALRVAQGGPYAVSTVKQMSDDPMPKEAGRAKYGYGPPMAHTRGSPRLQASNVRSSVSPSIASVFARRRRRGTAIEAASTT